MKVSPPDDLEDGDESAPEKPAARSRPAKPAGWGNPYRVPLLALLGAYVPFLAALFAVPVLLGGYLIWTGTRASQPGDGLAEQYFRTLGIAGGGVLLALSGHIGFGLLAVFRATDERDPLEIELPDQWQAGLSELVARVARDHELRSPDVIRLHAASVAHVYQDRRGKSVLVVGGVAVAALPRTALAGVVAHELAHFTAGDTDLFRVAGRWHRVMDRLDLLFLTKSWVKWNPLAWAARGFHKAYAAVWFAHARAAEYAADRLEVRHVGKDRAAGTLVLLEVLGAMPWTNLTSVAEVAVETNTPLEHLFGEQVRRVRAAGPSEWEGALKKQLRKKTHWNDSHPALAERLAALGVKPKKALAIAREMATAGEGESATALFANWPVVEKFLTKRVMEIVREIVAARQQFAADVDAIAGALERHAARSRS